MLYLSCGRVEAYELPKFLAGTWQVREVHVNTSSGRSSQYRWNDPRLMWRLFIFQGNRVTNDTENFTDTCEVTSSETTSMPLRNLMLASIGGYGFPPTTDANPVADYELGIGSNAIVTAIRLVCSDGLWQRGLGVSYSDPKFVPVSGAWIVSTSDGGIYIRWRDETILKLAETPAESIKPTFDCASAKKVSEVAICRSTELSSLDRSIKEAFGQSVKQAELTGGNERKLRQNQQDWLIRRNACGDNERCLDQTMRDRIDELVTGSQ